MLRKSSKARVYNKSYIKAVKEGNLESVKRLVEDPNVIVYNYYDEPTNSNQIEIIDYLLSIKVPYKFSDICYAIHTGRFDILFRFIDDNPDILGNILLNMVVESIKINEEAIGAAKKMILMLKERGPAYTPLKSTMYDAFISDSLDMIKFLYEHGYPYDGNLYNECYSNVEILKFLYEVMGVKHSENVDPVAGCIRFGNVECLEYLLSKGFTMTNEYITNILLTSNIDMIKYLHEIGYKWDITFDVSDIEDEAVLNYCHDNNIPNNWKCERNCKLCIRVKVDKITEMWKEDDNKMQWITNSLLDKLCYMLRKIADIDSDD